MALSRKGPAIRKRGSIAGWLYQVAYRAATKARKRTAARTSREAKAPARPPAGPLDEATGRELLAVLDEEMQRLPDDCRASLVLCYLQGQTRDQAARQLGCSLRTLNRRLEDGKKQLHRRLQRRGLELPMALLAAGVVTASVPRALAAAAKANGQAVTGSVAGLAGEALRGMTSAKLKGLAIVLAVGLLAAGAGIAVHRPPPAGAGQPPTSLEKQPQSKPQPAVAPQVAQPAPQIEAKDRAIGMPLTVAGQVTGPDRKPVPGSDVAVVAWSHRMPRDGEPTPPPEVWAHGKADETGHFRLVPLRSAPPVHYRQYHYQMAVIAMRSGFGLGWHFLRFDSDRTDLKVVLRPEQVRRGRVIDLKGQPAVGVRVDVYRIGKPAPKYEMNTEAQYPDGETFLGHAGMPASGTGMWEGEVSFPEAPEGLPGWPAPATTDAEGRFAFHGIGQGDAVSVRVHGNDQVATEERSLPASADAPPEEQTFSLGSPFLIEGTVTDAQTGKPIPDASVHVQVSGAALFTPGWPVPADWKGRQDCAAVGFTPSSAPCLAAPSEAGRTDARGRYRISALRSNFYQARQFAVIVSGAPDVPYVAVKKTIRWPKGTVQQHVDMVVPRGVVVRGTVVDQANGKPIPGARIDVWSKNTTIRTGEIELPADGPLHIFPRYADPEGKFELIAPAGRCHLLVNGPRPEFVVDRIEAAEIGVKDYNTEAEWVFIPPGNRLGRKAAYYPDRVVALGLEVGKGPKVVTAALGRAPVLKGQVLGADGKPAREVRMVHGQEPYLEPGACPYIPPVHLAAGVFEVPLRTADVPLHLAFWDAERRLGAVASFTARQAQEGSVTVRLAPTGSASLRLLDGAGKPLASHEPALWLSLPPEPYAAAQDLEKLIARKSRRWGFDALYVLEQAPPGTAPKTGPEGRITLPGLLPGATYRLLLSGGKEKVFKAQGGKAIDLGELTIAEPDKLREPTPAPKSGG